MAESNSEVMKDIGSIFPIYKESLDVVERTKERFSGGSHYSLCREALLDIATAMRESNKVVLLPAYTCDTVYMPFRQEGWVCQYYSIKKNLRIDIESLKAQFVKCRPALVVAHPYYGMEMNDDEKEALQALSSQGTRIVVDNTQCIFSEIRWNFVDFYVGSYRKWFPIPDGGFLENYSGLNISSPTEENSIFTSLQTGAMYLRSEYFDTQDERMKQLSIKLNKAANLHSVGEIKPHTMSSFSENTLAVQNLDVNKAARLQNYKYLYEHLHFDFIEYACTDIKNITTAPLYFPIYLKNRALLQRYLAKYHIYLPVIWPVDDDGVLIDETVKDIYETTLCIPVDQRYDLDDMKKIVELIEQFNYEEIGNYRS